MRYFVIAYVDNEDIIFFRTTSTKKLNDKIDELNLNNVLYNTLTMNGFDISFR